MTVVSAALLLFLVMDPLGCIPLLFSALKKVESARHSRIIVRELLIALVLLVFFLFLGQHFLKWFHISDPALTVSGGVILFLIALRMVFPSAEKSLHEDVEGEPFIVPLAVPYIVGPSAFATVMLLMTKESQRWPEWLLAVFLAWLACAIILLSANYLRPYLSPKILLAVERLMGMILIMLSVQMLMSGIQQFMNQ